MSALLACLAFALALAAYTVACYFIFRWMFVAQLESIVDHLDVFYLPRFIDGIRYAAHVVGGKTPMPPPRVGEDA